MQPDIKKLLLDAAPGDSVPLKPVDKSAWTLLTNADVRLNGLASTSDFSARPGQVLVVPDSQTGKPAQVFVGTGDLSGDPFNMWSFATAATRLPDGAYSIDHSLNAAQAYKVAVGWALARYRFAIQNGAIDSDPGDGARLVIPPAAISHLSEIKEEIAAVWRARDLINAPANILNTRELAQEVIDLAASFNAVANVTGGAALEKSFPLVHAVGRAAAAPPLLAELDWRGSAADDNAPSILLVGKGVTFDSGGLQVKSGDSMAGMKKDMGGAAIALALARLIMAADMPVRLKLVVPTAENAISGNAFRPGDIIAARDGTTIEISHTDAEGRLLLADALAYGIESANPDYILDFATLTGAQRIADGTEVGGLFASDKSKGRALEDISEEWSDSLQLHHLYEDKYGGLIKSSAGADLASSPRSGPGATTAALFLQHFTRAAKPGALWLHFDVNGANVGAKPGRPAGGEPMGLRSAYRFLKAELGL